MTEQVTLTLDEWKSLEADGKFGRVFVITVRQLIDDDGEVIKAQKHRRPIEPTADVSGEPLLIQRVCKVVRTPEALARLEAVEAVELEAR